MPGMLIDKLPGDLFCVGAVNGEAAYIAFITFYRKSTSAKYLKKYFYNCFFWLKNTVLKLK